MDNKKSAPYQPSWKQTILPIAIGVAGLAVAVVSLALQVKGDDKIVYVDSNKLLTGYKGMEAAKKEYQQKVESWNGYLDTLRAEFEATLTDYEKKEKTSTAKEKALMEEVLEAKRGQFMNYQQITNEKIKKEDQELTLKVYEKINTYLKAYGEKKGYAIIFAATQYGNIVYAQEATDITDEVLEGLNAGFEQ